MYREGTKSYWLVGWVALIALLVVASCGSNSIQDAIVGKWQANLGSVMFLGDVTEYMEFFKDGTVTAQTKISDFVGNYKFIADDTVRIDWKEQGAIGNTPTQILKVSISSDKLILTDQDGKATEYIRTEALQRTEQAIEANPLGQSDSDLSDLSGRIVFSSENDIYIINANGTNPKKVITAINQGGGSTSVAVSGDGSQIVFDINTGDREDISVANIDGTNLQNLTKSQQGRSWGATWSPDKRSLAYLHEFGVWLMNADGTNPHPLPVTGGSGSVTWSPDGRLLAYDSDQGIFQINADGNNPKQLTTDTDSLHSANPAWSPDGHLIAFTVWNGKRPDWIPNIYIMNADGTNQHQLTTSGGALSPTWSPDGHFIAYIGNDGQNKTGDVYVINVDKSNPRKLTNSPTRSENTPKWIQ